MGVWIPGVAAVTGFAEPEQVRSLSVSDGVLNSLRVPPVLGRWLSAEDQEIGAPEVVLISHGYWRQRFGGDRAVIGRKLIMDARPREILGVMPVGFSVADTPAALILPIRFDRSRTVLAGFGFHGVARLKAGVSVAQANADMERLIPIWMDSWPISAGEEIGNPLAKSVYTSWRITPALRPLRDRVVGNVGSVLWVVMGTLGVLMLVACANIANLMLVRAEARQREYAVRTALGAGWRRIAGIMLTESMVLSLAGGALGAAAAYGGLQLLHTIGPANLPRSSEISLDATALLFTLAAAMICGFLFGGLPVLKYAGSQISLATGGHGQSEPGRAPRVQYAGGGAGGVGAGAVDRVGPDDSNLPKTPRRGAGFHAAGFDPDVPHFDSAGDGGRRGASDSDGERDRRQTGSDSGGGRGELRQRGSDGR